jgi:hypothetical protein
VFMQAAMCEFAQSGNLVYHGQAGQQLLPHIGHVVKVRLIAPLERRTRSAMERQKMTHDAALKHIQRIDEERYRRMRELFDVDWRDPGLYDVVLNTQQMSLETAAEVVVAMAQQPDFQPSPRSEKALEDLSVGARVKAALAISPSTSDIPLEVQADSGVVHITGVITAIDDGRLEDEVRAVASATSGVRSVVIDVQFRPVLAHPG